MKDKTKIKELTDGYFLDHGGIIYPYIAKPDWNQVFRLEAELDEKIDVQNIVSSLTQLRRKFPSFFVTIEKRKYFVVLKKTVSLPDIVPEGGLCLPFDLAEKSKPLFRITYSQNRLGMELFHSVADGTGAMIFFANLIAQYYINEGRKIDTSSDIFNHGFKFEKSDTENSFLKAFDPKAKNSSRSEKPAYQYGSGKPEGELSLTTFKTDVNVLKDYAKGINATVTELLVAVYTKALCMCAINEDKTDKNIKIEVPMNLRKRYDSTTLRNFSLYFITSAPPDCADASLEDIVEILKPQFVLGSNTKKLTQDIHTNVSQSEMPVFKALPNFVKKGLLKVGSAMYGERLFTSPLSNIGVITLPEDIKKHILSFGFVIGRTLKNTVYSGVLTYENELYWCLSSATKSDSLEKNIQKILGETGAQVQITKR
ncbi:MAG: hypothetical protein K6B52_06570 [Clostridiales bacterium]|nr:hypothetical protein [Clostridiales bacterium]